MKKTTLTLLTALLLAPLAALHAAETPKPDAKPNIVFILADDKYDNLAQNAQKPADYKVFLALTGVWQITRNYWELMGITRS